MKLPLFVIILLLAAFTFALNISLNLWWLAAYNTITQSSNWEVMLFKWNKLFAFEPLIDFVILHTLALFTLIAWGYIIFKVAKKITRRRKI